MPGMNAGGMGGGMGGAGGMPGGMGGAGGMPGGMGGGAGGMPDFNDPQQMQQMM